MKVLETQFTKKGFRYTQVKREGDIAIYEQYQNSIGKVVGFEVFRIAKNKAYMIAGNIIPDQEAVPGNEKWGTEGFTCGSLASAEIRFQQLLKRHLETI